MSSAAAELDPKHACKACGKPFEPEKEQEICDDCRARRATLWIIALALLLAGLTLLPFIVRTLNPPRPEP